MNLRVLLAAILCGPAPCAFGADDASPKEIEVKSTIHCIGINWTLEGDDNRNAACTVGYRRKGTEAWREGLGLFRIKHRWRDAGMNNSGRDVNAMCGSLFRLAPGTTYEIKLNFKDPDGGEAEKVLESTTMMPAFPRDGKWVHVAKGELEAKLAAARPGDILVLAKGDHGKGFAITQGGAPDNYLVLTGAGVQEAKIGSQIDVQASHVWIDNLLLEHPAVEFPARGATGVKVHPKVEDVIVSRCRILHAKDGVHVYGRRTVACDNYIKGDKPPWAPHDQIYRHPIEERRAGQLGGEGVDFGHDRGGRFVAAFNEITHVADGVSYGDNNTDVCHNLIYEICDDNIEPDYAYDNYRVWGNNGRTGLVGFSFQPMNGGPWYFFNNQMTGNGSYLFKIKDNDGRGPCVWVNNTLVQTRNYLRYHVVLQSGGIWANNVWAHLPKGALGSSYEDFSKNCTRFFDYNAYATGDPAVALIQAKKKWTLDALKEIGLDTHSHFIDAVKDLTNIPENSESRHPGTSEPIRPREGTPMIDGGVVLPNITGPYEGQAPDIGAYEKGLGIQWHGPRRYTKNGFAYGLPAGWRLEDTGEAELKLAKDAPKAGIVVTFEKLEGEARWTRFESLLSEGADEKSGKIHYWLDSLAGRVLKAGPEAQLVAAQIDPRGVWIVKGSCAAGDLAAVQEDFFTLAGSMQQTLAVYTPAP